MKKLSYFFPVLLTLLFVCCQKQTENIIPNTSNPTVSGATDRGDCQVTVSSVNGALDICGDTNFSNNCTTCTSGAGLGAFTVINGASETFTVSGTHIFMVSNPGMTLGTYIVSTDLPFSHQFTLKAGECIDLLVTDCNVTTTTSETW